MEAPQRRRLSILASHLRPITTTDVSSSIVTRSHCNSCSGSETDCVFCKIVRGDAPALKLYEDDECLCFLDNNPVSPGARDCLWASESLKRHPLKLDQEALHLVNNIRQQLSFDDGFEDNKDHGTTLIGS